MYEAAGAESQRKNTKTAGELSKILIDQDNFSVEEERKLLGKILKSSENGDHILDIGTKLFIDKAVKVTPQFMQLIDKHYNSEVDNVKFSDVKETIDVINEWSSNATHGKIPKLVDESEWNWKFSLFQGCRIISFWLKAQSDLKLISFSKLI